MRGAGFAMAAAMVLGLGAAGPASASTIDVEGSTVVYRAASGEENTPYFTMVETDAGERLDIADIVTITRVDPGCAIDPDDDRHARCMPPGQVRAELGDGDDMVDFGTLPDELLRVPAEVLGGDGADRLEDNRRAGHAVVLDGGPGDDRVDGYEGDDVVRGGPGNDRVDGGQGNDRVEGGDGNDEVFGDGDQPAGTDVVDGGPGLDKLHEYADPEATSFSPITLTLDGLADDGRPGEGDNVTGVETIMSNVGGTYAGTDAPESFDLWGNMEPSPSTVRAAGGDDRVLGDDQVENIDGGPGADTLEGGYNNDTITGGPGPDRIFGDRTRSSCGIYSRCTVPFGNDTINAADGEPDTIDCGLGTDRAVVDLVDIVAKCETVVRPEPYVPPKEKDVTKRATVRVVGPRTLRRLLRQGLTVEVPCAAACSVRGALVVGRKNARLMKLGRGRVLARGQARLGKAGTATVVLKVSRRTARRVRRMRPRRLTTTLRITVREGRGKPKPTQQKLTLRR